MNQIITKTILISQKGSGHISTDGNTDYFKGL